MSEDQAGMVPVNGKAPILPGDPSLRLIIAEIIDKTVDAKTIVIWAVTIIVIVAMFKMPDSKEIVTNALSGLFGVAVGRSMK